MMRSHTNLILVRVDGHKKLGMGHLYEMLTLSKYLRDEYGLQFFYVTRNNRAAIELIENNGFKLIPLPFNISYNDEISQLKQIVKDETPRAIFIDLINIFDKKSLVRSVKTNNSISVVFSNDHKATSIPSDIIFKPSILQNDNDYLSFKDNNYYLGFDYVIMPLEYSRPQNRITINNQVKKVMICMGGSDHRNLTFSVLKAIDRSKFEFSVDIVLNSSFFDKKTVSRALKRLNHRAFAHYDTDGILDILLKSDLAITAGGNTHIERLCVGVPGIVIPQLVHQDKSANRIAESGSTINLGLPDNLNLNRILDEFNHLMSDKILRESISKKGKELVDGRGLHRIANIIVDRINA